MAKEEEIDFDNLDEDEPDETPETNQNMHSPLKNEAAQQNETQNDIIKKLEINFKSDIDMKGDMSPSVQQKEAMLNV